MRKAFTVLEFSNSFANSKTKIVLFNEITLYNFEATHSFTKIVNEFSNLWRDIDFVDLSEENWMRISLKMNWESRVNEKVKVYSLESRNKKLVDKIFDDLHASDKMFWTNEFTSFSYLVFCVWRNQNDERKKRIVVNIRGLNVITQLDAYSLSLQANIISLLRHCLYISIIDCSTFFYQWRVHSSNRHKLTIVSHREQESFNVVVMRYKNSSAYVQRQIDRLLRVFRRFARAYVNDIVIFSRIAKEHVTHLREIFFTLIQNNIFIKSIKTFIEYFTVSLLSQKVDSLDLATTKEKLRAISKLRFSQILRQLKTFLDLTSWLRDYVSHYAGLSKSLQNKKTELLRFDLVAESARKNYFSKTRMQHSTEKKIVSFRAIQTILSKPSYLIHVDSKRQLFIDLNVSKEFDFETMLYYLKEIYLQKTFAKLSKCDFLSRHVIELVLFLSRLISSIESNYWSTELKIADIVWILKKVRHIVEVSFKSIIVYTDHDVALGLVKQITLITTSTNKLNLRLIRVFDYIQRFNLKFRHKLEKQHIVLNALSRLASDNVNSLLSDEGVLDALFIISLVEMNEDFRKRILDEYKIDLNWKRIVETLENDSENAVKLSFYRDHELIFRFDDFTIEDHVYESRRLCISHSMINDILDLAHNDEHFDFARCFDRISASWYIRDLSRYLRDYLKHCSQCQIYQTRRHVSYDSLQFILTSSISFHTITIDFILALSKSTKDYDITMSISCKFNKRVILILEKVTFIVALWGEVLLDRLNIANWGLLKVIISNRDRKFLFDMWIVMFNKLEVKLLYFTVYHSQTNDQFERTNQTVEIALRFHLSRMFNFAKWSRVLFKIQRHLNNFTQSAIGKTSNETVYDFTSVQALNLTKSLASETSSLNAQASRARIEVFDFIVFDQMSVKHYYDKKHHSLSLRVENYALLRLHREYNISFTKKIDLKLSQQLVDFFKVLERIERLVYKLDISSNWRIHSIFTIAQLESCSSSNVNSYNRKRLDHSNFVFVKDDTKKIKSWELKVVIDKREIARDIEYLVRWKGYGSKHDVWRSLLELENVMKLVKTYENAMRAIIFLSDRHLLSSMKNQSTTRNASATSFSTSTIEKELVLAKRRQLSTSTRKQLLLIVIEKRSLAEGASRLTSVFTGFAKMSDDSRRSTRLFRQWYFLGQATRALSSFLW